MLVLIGMWVYDQFFTFLNTGRCTFYTISCHSPGGNTAAALGDRVFHTIYAHSAQRDTAAALAEFVYLFELLL